MALYTTLGSTAAHMLVVQVPAAVPHHSEVLSAARQPWIGFKLQQCVFVLCILPGTSDSSSCGRYDAALEKAKYNALALQQAAAAREDEVIGRICETLPAALHLCMEFPFVILATLLWIIRHC